MYFYVLLGSLEMLCILNSLSWHSGMQQKTTGDLTHLQTHNTMKVHQPWMVSKTFKDSSLKKWLTTCMWLFIVTYYCFIGAVQWLLVKSWRGTMRSFLRTQCKLRRLARDLKNSIYSINSILIFKLIFKLKLSQTLILQTQCQNKIDYIPVY